MGQVEGWPMNCLKEMKSLSDKSKAAALLLGSGARRPRGRTIPFSPREWTCSRRERTLP
ncbi:MAG TPA: hypothetical protein VGN95_15840 [Pyrinomonadaceae bacterium]|nr:hypothetical protein [Pyrinomonadaceae bacterium]